MSTIKCTGNDGCPICKMMAECKPKKQYAVNVVDKNTGEMKVMRLSEEEYDQYMKAVSGSVRKYTGKFWNVVLPVGLTLLGFACVFGFFVDIYQNGSVTFIGRIYATIGLVVSFAFLMIKAILDRSDEDALVKLEKKGHLSFYR